MVSICRKDDHWTSLWGLGLVGGVILKEVYKECGQSPISFYQIQLRLDLATACDVLQHNFSEATEMGTGPFKSGSELGYFLFHRALVCISGSVPGQ